jgi:hypothetical protein
MPVDVPPYWTTDQLEQVADGTGPVALGAGNGKLHAAYSPTEGQIMLATRENDVWTSQDIGLNSGYGEFADMSVDGDVSIVYAQATLPDDLWCSEGPLDDDEFRVFRINGDGGTALGTPQSGFYIKALKTPTNWVVAHIEATSDSVLYHTRAISGSAWTTETMTSVSTLPFHYSIANQGETVFALARESLIPTLLLGSNSGSGFEFTDISSEFPGDDPEGYWNSLTPFNGGWFSASVTPGTGALSVINNADGAWERELIDDRHGFTMRSQMLAGSDKIYLVYLANDPTQWYFAVYDLANDTWTQQRLAFEDVIAGDSLDMTLLDDQPYFVFDEREGTRIWCATINPPAL